jgi:site-specific DNA-methyltransferase (adenine-specific)
MIKLLHGDCRDLLRTLPDASVHACITSPPYWNLRSYLHADHPDKAREIGSESSPDAYLATMVAVFREVKRVLRNDGVMFCNMGDAYSNKQLQMMPARLALALQADGWWLRSMLPWLKRSAMPESVTDRPASAVEYVFLLTKSARYFWDAEAVKRSAQYGFSSTEGAKIWGRAVGVAPMRASSTVTPGDGGSRNMRNSDLFYDSLEDAPEPTPRMRRVKIPGGWDTGDGAHGTVHRNGRTSAEYQEQLAPVADRGPSPEPLGLICDADGSPLALDVNPAAFSAAHFATFPPKLVEPLIRAGCPPGGTVLDPFAGAGTTLLVADRLQRDAIGIELSDAYGAMADARVVDDAPLLAWGAAQLEAAE